MRSMAKLKRVGLFRLFADGRLNQDKKESDLDSPQPIKKDDFDMVVKPDPAPPKPRESTVFITKTSHIIPGRQRS